jgi:hypothetical protein
MSISEMRRDATAARRNDARWSAAIIAVFVVAIVLRVLLAIVNVEANDDHLSVVRIISEENRIPGPSETWESWQPKLYHATVAILWRVSPGDSREALNRLGQLVNCVAGIATIFIIYRFLLALALSRKTIFLTFALAALNPKMVGLSVQMTNDAFVILFGSLTIFLMWRFLTAPRIATFAGAAVAAILATLSKGNGIVIFVALFATLVIALLQRSPVLLPRSQLSVATAVFAIASIVAATFLGSYAANYREKGSPFAISVDRDQFPSFFRETFVHRPGVTSIAQAYFTFNLTSLIRDPMVNYDPEIYPIHRRSLWSQVYGRSHFVHFDAWPPSWEQRTPFMEWLGRIVLIVALIPTAILLMGFVWSVRRSLALVRRIRELDRDDLRHLFLTMTAGGYIAFLVLYTMTYRDFPTMKAEFMLPGILTAV